MVKIIWMELLLAVLGVLRGVLYGGILFDVLLLLERKSLVVLLEGLVLELAILVD
jgi:hypothetical protein